MNKEQRDNVLALINNYNNLDINAIINTHYKDQDISTKMINEDTSISTVVSTIERVFKQFKHELSNNNYDLLPYIYNFQNDYGSGSLDKDVRAITSFITQNAFNDAFITITRLAYYQYVHGFWDKSTKSYFNADELELPKIKTEITLYANQVKQLFEQLTENKKKLEDFHKQKQSELQEIANLLQTSRNQTSEITQFHTQTNANNATINQILTQQRANLQQANDNIKEQEKEFEKLITDEKKQFDGLKKEYEQLNSKLADLVKNIEKQNADFAEKLAFVESKTTYFEQRNKFLDDLIGREVGASLFETFKQRKLELHKSVHFWRWAVPVTTGFIILWIFILFGNWLSSSNTLQGWEFFALNTLKTIPVIFLLFFSISQYKKERNFQEEYAFKSAVALTIEEYAKKFTDTTQKDAMIMNAVKGIFTPPTEIQSKIDETKTEVVTEVIKNLKEVLVEGLKTNKK